MPQIQDVACRISDTTTYGSVYFLLPICSGRKKTEPLDIVVASFPFSLHLHLLGASVTSSIIYRASFRFARFILLFSCFRRCSSDITSAVRSRCRALASEMATTWRSWVAWTLALGRSWDSARRPWRAAEALPDLRSRSARR